MVEETAMNQNGQSGLNLVFIALAVLILIVAVIYLVNHT
jgi:hypothetical protein